ncbi:Scr1 family TA system antitoxin-like transcriptional regulator [Streptomyces sp. NPDC006656]|uniref:Scr1 family TA system antitoxin-like transcriptional regulator n=1 Tax=Streptomyces sp. NPDC006656 TaxID=3156899 RepID=UPI003456339E
MRRAQEDVFARNAAARTCRAYVSNVLPGFFQTADYAEALMRSITGRCAPPRTFSPRPTGPPRAFPSEGPGRRKAMRPSRPPPPSPHAPSG